MEKMPSDLKELFFPASSQEEELAFPLVEIQETSKDVSLENLDEDFKISRETIKSVIDTTTLALADLTQIMKASDSPRAFEVGNQLLTTLANVSKDLLEVHERYHKMKDKQMAGVQNIQNVQNNLSTTVYTGTTKELLKLINENLNPRQF